MEEFILIDPIFYDEFFKDRLPEILLTKFL